MDLKKAGSKNRVIVLQKEKKQPGLFSFWITMTLFFAPCFQKQGLQKAGAGSAKSRVPDLLKVPDPKKISGRPDILE